MSFEIDPQYVSHRIERVDVSQGENPGWSLSFENGSGIFCPAASCSEEPKPGETARLYGRGFGHAVRGIVIEARMYRYRTEAEAEADHVQWVADQKRARQERLERELPKRDARRAALPEAFRLRIEGFIAARPDWRRDHEGYELFVCEEAAQIAAHFAGNIDGLKAFNHASLDEQKAALPELRYAEHSGNTWGSACYLAALALAKPEFVAKAHGALCPLLGCEEYGCHAARGEEGQ